MNPNIKKALLIILLFLVAGLIAFGLYFAFKKTKLLPAGTDQPPVDSGATGQLPASGERTTTTIGAEPGEDTLPSAGVIPTPSQTSPLYRPNTITKVTDDYAAYASLGTNGSIRYQNANDGKFYQIDSTGSLKPLSDKIFYNVKNVTWTDKKNQAVLEYPDDSKIIYNFDLNRQVTLPKHWQEFSFSPDGNEVVAKSVGLSPENRWLVVTKDDGTETRLIEPMGTNGDKVTVAWSPSRQTVALSRTGEPQGADRQEVLFVGLNHENFKSTIVEGRDFQPAWSPSGQQLLYSVDSFRSDFKPELWIVDAYGEEIGSNRRSIGLYTWAKKCAFADDNTLYCAVPKELPQGAGMSPEIADQTPDDLYKIDLKTGLKTNIPTGENYHMSTISYDKTKHKIFFTDGNQTGIFKVNL